MSDLHAAFAACERIVREQAKNFWYGLRLTPEPKRSAMYAIYAWMRQADDLADEPGPGREGPSAAARRRRLEAFRRDTDQALAGTAPDASPVWTALAAIAPQYELVAQDFHDMLEGQLADLGDDRGEVRLATWEDLRTQCYRVASTVGLVCIRIWGFRDERAKDLAIARGIAFQLTNIIRDIREDHGNGRIYLPADELRAAGLSVEELLAWGDAPRCQAFLETQIERARAHYRASEGLERLITPDCVATLWALTSIYSRLLERIAADPRRAVVGERVRLPKWEKVWIAFRARSGARQAAAAPAGEVVTP